MKSEKVKELFNNSIKTDNHLEFLQNSKELLQCGMEENIPVKNLHYLYMAACNEIQKGVPKEDQYFTENSLKEFLCYQASCVTEEDLPLKSMSLDSYRRVFEETLGWEIDKVVSGKISPGIRRLINDLKEL